LLRLFISIDWYLPGTNSSGPVRSVANLVEQLPGVEVFIFTRNTDYCSDIPYANIVLDTWTAVSTTVAVYYASPLENAYMESLHSNVQREVVERYGFESIYHAQVIISHYYGWCNNHRKHVSLE
jgi:hypothetical protein